MTDGGDTAWNGDQTWGIPPERRNRLLVRALIAVLSTRPRRRPAKWLRRTLRDVICLVLTSDVRCSRFGPGLYLPHPWGIVVHARTQLGARCTIYHNVTIGEDNVGPGVPTIGDDVVIGAGAVLLGPIWVGDGARIGANAVVLRDVPPGATAVGAPARVLGP